jgi:hypothetical protein
MPQHDDHDDLAAMDFSGADGDGHAEPNALDLYDADDDSGGEAAVNVLDAYATAESGDTGGELDGIPSPTDEDGSQTEEEEGYVEGLQQYTVANPSATVSVSTFIGGTIHRVDLSPKVASMGESALTDEILVLADLARKKGLAGQRTYMAEVMQALGVDDGAAVSDLLDEDLALPTPEKAEEAQAEVFATRYQG